MKRAWNRVLGTAAGHSSPAMRTASRIAATSLLTGLVAFGVSGGPATADSGDKVARTHAALGQYLQDHPEMVVDFSKVSGEYCINALKVKGGHMTHYAIDPSKTTEDVVLFVDAQPFLDAGIDFSTLPRLPDSLGTMKTGQWYYLPKGAPDPHHGAKRSKRAMLVRATDIQ